MEDEVNWLFVWSCGITAAECKVDKVWYRGRLLLLACSSIMSMDFAIRDCHYKID